MSPLEDSCLKKLLLLHLFISLLFISPISAHHQNQQHIFGPTTRVLLALEKANGEDGPPIITKKKSTPTTEISTTKTNPTKPTSNPSKNQTKPIKTPSDSSHKNNKTKPIKTTPSEHPSPAITKSQIKKINNSSNKNNNHSTSKSNTTSPLTKKPSDLKNKTQSEIRAQKKQPSWIDDDEVEEDDLVAGFRDLPARFQETIVPDLEKISKTSQIYLTRYNKEFARGFKPYFGNKYSAAIAPLVSFSFILSPLIVVSLIFTKIKAYFSLQRLLIFIQVYLAIYFAILCLSSSATGLEPLRFFYSASRPTYVCVQVLQALGYLVYLVLLLMYLILVFSTGAGLATRLVGLGQTFVGFAVGLHYYVTVFHRAVLNQPPRSGWKAHGLYATCFVVVCLLGRVDGRKKAYLEEGGEEGKKS